MGSERKGTWLLEVGGVPSPLIKVLVPYPHHLKCSTTYPSLQPLQPPQEIFLHGTMLKSLQPHPIPQLLQERRDLAEVSYRVKCSLTLPAVPMLVPLGQAIAQDEHKQQ